MRYVRYVSCGQKMFGFREYAAPLLRRKLEALALSQGRGAGVRNVVREA